MTSDPNDTSGEAGNAWTAARQPGAVPAPSAEEQRAATLSLGHADTPSTTHVDALGRVFLAQARLDGATVAETRTELDIEGQVLGVRDALKDGQGVARQCAQSVYAVGGQVVWSLHVDSGKGFTLADVLGAPLYAGDAVGHRVRTEFDVLRRPTHVWVKKGSDPEWLSQRLVYGEAAAQPEGANLRGKVLHHFDGAGLASTGAHDFKGNLLSSSRRLAVTYTGEPDWSALALLTDPAAILAAAALLDGWCDGSFQARASRLLRCTCGVCYSRTPQRQGFSCQYVLVSSGYEAGSRREGVHLVRPGWDLPYRVRFRNCSGNAGRCGPYSVWYPHDRGFGRPVSDCRRGLGPVEVHGLTVLAVLSQRRVYREAAQPEGATLRATRGAGNR